MAKTKPILNLIDISSYIYRAYHAIRGLTNSKGFPTNAVFGVTNMLLKVLRERQPQYLALVFDAKGPTFRHKEYAEYKTHRPPMPDELAMQLPYIYQVIQGLNLPALVREGFEADDLICTLAHRAKEQGFQVEIISSDKDLLPLVQEGVTMWDPMKDVRYDPEVIKDKYGLMPEELVEMRALAGDASDNIPGVPGIGEKTAVKLIAKYHSLENLLAHVEEIREKALKGRLREFADQARLSRKLTVLECAVPLDTELAVLQPGHWDREVLRRLFVELEFSKFNKELGSEASQAGALLLVQSLEDLEQVTTGIRASREMSLFFVLGKQHPVLAPVAGLGLAWRLGKSAYIPFGQKLSPEVVWEKLRPLWTEPCIHKVGADLKTTILVAGCLAPDPAGISGDILLASYLLNPVRYEQNLENVALHYLGVNLPGPRELAGRPLAAADLPLELACRYGGERAETALRLWPLLEADLKKEGLWNLYRNLELPLLTVLAHMEARGMLLEQDFLRQFAQDLDGHMQRLEKEIYKAAGEVFLIQSTQQLSRILFEKLNIMSQKKTKGKMGYSTDSEVLQSLAHEAPIAAKILEYRRLGKLKATYVDALLRLVDPATGQVHTTFLQSVAATGRLSSRDPNLQNIPVRGELGAQIRQAFIAPLGQVFLSADYSQMELRLLAHFSGDPLLLKAFQEGVDIHRQTAAVVFGIHPELVTLEMRRQAKVVNFGIIYGMSAFRLAKQLGVGNRMAHEFIQRYFQRHSRVQAYLEKTLEQARQQGWVTTLLGRRRQISQINSGNRILRREAERAAINTPLQGTAADIIKKAMLELELAFKMETLGANMLLQLHDELLFEVPESELAATARVVQWVMEEVVLLQVPLVVEIRSGSNWGEMYPYGPKREL